MCLCSVLFAFIYCLLSVVRASFPLFCFVGVLPVGWLSCLFLVVGAFLFLWSICVVCCLLFVSLFICLVVLLCCPPCGVRFRCFVCVGAFFVFCVAMSWFVLCVSIYLFVCSFVFADCVVF